MQVPLYSCYPLYMCIYMYNMFILHSYPFSDAVLPGTDPAPLRGEHQVAIPTSEQGPSKEGGTTSRQPGLNTPQRLSSTPKNVCWPELRALQHEFSSLVSSFSEAIHALNPAQFINLLVYLRERLRPMVDGCFPTGEPANLPRGEVTPLELIQHLQDGHYWDYLNTNLLEDVIGRATKGNSPLRSQMTKYKENFCSKVTHTLEECEKKNVKPKPPKNYTMMAVEINRNLLSFHLHQTLQLRDLLVNTFGVSDALFAGFVDGSIVLYFFIPEEAVYSLCPKLESNCTALQDLHVTTVVVFDHFLVDVGFQQMTLLKKVSAIHSFNNL